MASNLSRHAPSHVQTSMQHLAAMLAAALAASTPALGAAQTPPEDLLAGILPSAAVDDRKAAFAEIAASEDETYLAPLLDLLALADTRDEWFSVLDTLTPLIGEDARALEGPWRTITTRLQKNKPLPLPDGYRSFKSELLAQGIDEDFRRFLGPNFGSTVRWDEVSWGGVEVDGIPALDDPKVMAASEASYLADDAPVFGVVLNGEARAYPNQILDWHEMTNDELGGVPISLTWCTLCGAPLVFKASRGEDEPRLTFGSSGLLYRSNKLMYDRATDTLWNQMTGRPVIGKRVERGDVAPLELLNVRTTTWGAWRADYPETTTIRLETGFERDYRVGAAYGEYFSSPRTMFPVAAPSGRYLPKERIMVAYLEGRAVSTTLEDLRKRRVVALGDPKSGLHLVSLEPADGPEHDPKLHPIHDALAFATGARRFKPTSNPRVLTDEDGDSWQVTDAELTHPTKGSCKRVPNHPAFGFSWDAHLALKKALGNSVSSE